MPIGRETVGEAYVRIIADTSGLKSDVEKALREQATIMEKAGTQNARRFNQASRTELDRQGGLGAHIINQLQTDMGKMGAVGTLLGDDFSKNLTTAMEKRFRGAQPEAFVQRFAQVLETDLRRAAMLGDVALQQIDEDTIGFSRDLRSFLVAAEEQVRKEFAATEREANKLATSVKQTDTASRNAAKGADLLVRALTRQKTALSGRQVELLARNWSDFTAAQDRARTAADHLAQAMKAGVVTPNLIRDLETAHRSMRRYSGDIKDMEAATRGMSKEMGRLSSALVEADLGKVFGRGARNNFVNFVGNVVTGIDYMADHLIKFITRGDTLPGAFARWGQSSNIFQRLIGRALSGVSTLVGNVAGVIARAGETIAGWFENMASSSNMLVRAFGTGGQGLGGLFSSLAGVTVELAPGLTGVAIALAAISTVVGGAVAGVSLLAGAATALASAISVGVIGAIAALAPVLAGAITGFGLFGLAVADVVNQYQKQATAVKNANTAVANARAAVAQATPGTTAYKNAVNKLNAALSRQAAVQENAKTGVLGMVQPLVDWYHAAKNILETHLFSGLKDDLKIAQPAFDSFLVLIRRISDAMANVFRGLAVAMRSPEFRAFQNQLNIYLPRIVGHLGNTFTNLFTALAGFFRAVLPWGDRLAGNIENITKRFSDWINSVKGQNAVKQFMDDAWTAAGRLWDIIVQVGRVIGAVLQQGRTGAGQDLLGGIQSSFTRLADYLTSGRGQKAIKQWFDDARQFAHDLSTTLSELGRWFDRLDTTKTRKQITGFIQDVQTGIQVVETIFAIGQRIAGFLRPFFQLFQDVGTVVADIFTNKWSKIPGVLADIGTKMLLLPLGPFGKNVQQAFDGAAHSVENFGKSVGNWFSRLPGIIGHALGTAASAVGGFFSGLWNSVSGAVESFGKSVGDWFSKLPGRIAHALGSAAGAVGGFFAGLARDIGGFFSGLWSSVVGAVESFGKSLLDWFTKLPGRMLSALGEWGPKLLGWILGGIAGALVGATLLGLELIKFFALLPFRIIGGMIDLGMLLGRWIAQAIPVAIQWIANLEATIGGWFARLPGIIGAAVGNLAGIIGAWMANAFNVAVGWAANIIGAVGGWFARLPGTVGGWLSRLPGVVGGWMVSAFNTAVSWAANIIGNVGNWFAQLPGRIGGFLSRIPGVVASWFSSAYNTAVHWAQSIVSGTGSFLSTLPGRIGGWLSGMAGSVTHAFVNAWDAAITWAVRIVTDIGNWFSGIPGKIGNWLSGLASAIGKPFEDAYNTVKHWVDQIGGALSHIPGASVLRHIPGIGGLFSAAGGIVPWPQQRIIGEAGPEAIVPLNRPLSQVDPSVRALSAVAQGMTTLNNRAATQFAPQQVFNISVYSTSDPEAVAKQVINKAVALARI